MYLGLYLGLCSILVIAGSGGVYMCSYCSCYGCYSYYSYCGVAGAAIKVVSNTAIGTTSGTVIGIANGISKAASRISRGFYGA